MSRFDAKIHIPETSQGAIVLLLELSDEQFEALEKALSSARPAVMPSWVTLQIPKQLGGPQDQLDPLVETLVTLRRLLPQWGMRASDLAKAVGAGAVEQKLGGLSEPGPDSERLRLRLERLLAVPTIEVSAKVFPLYTANREIFKSARVITDLRPIFWDADDPQLTAGMITHSLVVRTMSVAEDNDLSPETVHQIALDLDHLNALMDQIRGALAKEAALRAWMKGARPTLR